MTNLRSTPEAALYQQWVDAKHAEHEATIARRDIEDEILERMNISLAKEGTESVDRGLFKISCTTRMNRRVDADMMQQLAAEAGITDVLPSLCRWKPELNIKAWKSADEYITKALAPAIETKPGRPSFKIELSEV